MEWLNRRAAAVREALTLKQAEESAKAYSSSQAQRVRLLTDAARSRASVARSLFAPRDEATAVSLLRDAVALRLRAAREAGAIAPRLSEATTRTLDTVDPLELQAGTEQELAALRRDLDHDERQLSHCVEARSVRVIRTTRNARQAAVALALAWGAYRVIAPYVQPKDVALHKTVNASALSPYSAAPETLVDGEDESEKPVVTPRATGAWIMVDLGTEYVLDSVRLVNRTDSSFDDALPFYLEVALRTDQPWIEVARRRDHFHVWREPLLHRVARYVRVRCESQCAIGLNEVDVRGRRAH